MTISPYHTLHVEIAFDDETLEPDPEWTDITSYVRDVQVNRGRSTELDDYPTGKATFVLDNRARTFDPLHGPGSVDFTGASGCYASTPHSTANNVSGDTWWIVRVAFDSTAPASEQVIFAKGDTSSATDLSYALTITTTNKLKFYYKGSDGTVYTSTTTVQSEIRDTRSYWLKVEYDANNAGNRVITVSFCDRDEFLPTSSQWVVVETFTPGLTLNLAGGTQDLRIGADSTGAKRLTGNVEYFAMGKTLGAKTQTVRFSARGRSSATTSWTSAKGETWTLNGAAVLTGSSPYYGSLLPNRQIRAYVTTNEATPATRHLFRGYVDAWPQFYSKGNADATVVVEASDMFKIFSRIDKKSYYLTYIEETLNPEYWFKFDESPGAERCRNRGSGAQYNLHGTYHNMSAKDFERAAVVPYPDPDSRSVRFRWGNDEDDYPRVKVRNGYRFPKRGMSISFWFQSLSDGDGYSSSRILAWYSASDETKITLDLLNGIGLETYIYLQVQNHSQIFTGQGWKSNPTTLAKLPLLDQEPHLITLVFPPAGGLLDDIELHIDEDTFVNWTNVGSSPADLSIETTDSFGINMDPRCKTNIAGTNSLHKVIDDLMLFNRRLADTEHSDLYSIGMNGSRNQRSDVRIETILDNAEIPTALYEIGTGIQVLGGDTVTSESLLSALKAVETAEQGQLYIEADGVLKFRNRHWRLTNTNATDSQQTFSDNPTGSEVGYLEASFNYDDKSIRNEVVTRSRRGKVYTVKDRKSISQYGRITDDLTNLDDFTESQAEELAYYRLSKYAYPVMTVTGLRVLMDNLSLTRLKAIAALDFGHRVTVERTPQGVGNPMTLEVLIEGIDDELTPSGWYRTFYCSPASATAFVLLDSSTKGIIGSNALTF